MVKIVLFVLLTSFSFGTNANSLIQTIKNVKPSVVGIGVYTPTGQPRNQISGSGFAIGNGEYVATNYHVLPESLDQGLKQRHAVYSGKGKETQTHLATLVGYSKEYDLAILKLDKARLPAMQLADKMYVDEGLEVAFTGFPIASILGIYPVTHKGIVSSLTPTISPVADSRQINIHMLKKLRNPYMVYQLDATAYPGNSGSALYSVTTGEVIGIINKVFVQQSKEGVIANPSGITYAIPVRHLWELMEEHKVPTQSDE